MNFARKQTLATHAIVHTCEGKFKCEQFEKDFAQKCNVITYAIVRAVERKNKCEQCENCFTRRGNLIRHKAVHIGGIKFMVVCQGFYIKSGFSRAQDSPHW